MQQNKKLIFAWSVFISALATLAVVTKIYHDAKKENASNYQYRILINKDSYKTEIAVEKKEPTVSEKKPSTRDYMELYERSKYGDIPKISPDGARVLDIYSAKFSAGKKKKACLAVFVNKISPEKFSEVIKKLGNIKVTFVVPHYLEKFPEIANLIVNSGNEFLLQIPTQTSIPNEKKETVFPFFANTDKENLIDNLSRLLASAKYAIGIANTTSTLLTKSAKDMLVISEELSNRGLAFLDFEKANDISNDVFKKLPENPSFIQANVSENFLPNQYISIAEPFDGKIFAVYIEKLNDFLDEIAKHPEYVVAPVSSVLIKK